MTSTSSLVTVLLSAIAASLLATGLLFAIGAIVAGVQGTSLAQLYIEYFPVFRGSGVPTPRPQGLSAIVIAYSLVSAQLAISIRRALSGR